MMVVTQRLRTRARRLGRPCGRIRRDGRYRGVILLAVGTEFDIGRSHCLQHGLDEGIDLLRLVVGHHLHAEAGATLGYSRILDEVGDGAECGQISRRDACQTFGAYAHWYDRRGIAERLEAYAL